jgi:benzodiazapine receptor
MKANSRESGASRVSAPAENSTGAGGTAGPEGTVRRSVRSQALGLAAFLGLSALVAGLGGLVTAANVSGWYVAADKAPWSPPNWIFGPVWSLLYVAMAVAAWLVWRRRTPESKAALLAYWAQLGLNLLWTPVFFGLYPVIGSPALWLALAVILALAIALTFTVLLFGPISRTAGVLMLPYVSWVVFAGSLNLWAALHN